MKRRTKRDEVFDYIVAYASDHLGPTPSINEIAQEINRSYSTTWRHVHHLIREKRIESRDGKLIVLGAEWRCRKS